ncbi:MAG: sigma-70 family RNA polymerase sigma factor [Anaeromyxobacter sp.]
MADLSETLEETVRRERGRIVAGLVRLCGGLDAAEDAFHEAVLAAMRAWQGGLPDSPGAWLTAAARNAALDARRRGALAARLPPPEEAVDARETIDTVTDDHLRLVFTCCHPALSLDNQLALTLKVVSGLSTAELARAFVCPEETVSQRVLRAKRTLEELGVPYALPGKDELAGRVEGVLAVLRAVFNEGHTASSGPLMRLDLQAEALRLGRLVCELLPTDPEAHGLLALMAFGAARAKAREGPDGTPILLDAQDRSRWDRRLVREGLVALQRARTLGGRGPRVLEAELAALHVTAPRWEETDWAAIVAVYDRLLEAAPSPVASLNRAVAVSMLEGPAAGLALLEPLARPLAGYHLFHAVRADLLARAGLDPRPDLERALALSANEGERRLLEVRLQAARQARGA